MGNKASTTQLLDISELEEIDLVQKKKSDKKSIECEVWGLGDESAESETAWRSCTKNPNHVTFIPASQFNLGHLPRKYRKTPVVEIISRVSILTVRLRVNLVTKNRPKGYAFAENRGSRVPHVGTGVVQEVEVGKGRCHCRECSKSTTAQSPIKKWFRISIVTAMHVLYDTKEVQSTRIDFFYDNENSAKEGKMKTVWGEKFIWGNISPDICIFTCVTHDEDLYTLLCYVIGQYSTSSGVKQIPRDTIVVIVSHPHGMPKKVTIGKRLKYKSQWERVDAETTNYQLTYVYNADTCPGSSGALVLAIHYMQPGNYEIQSLGTIHAGGNSEGNYSVDFMVKFLDMDPLAQYCGILCFFGYNRRIEFVNRSQIDQCIEFPFISFSNLNTKIKPQNMRILSYVMLSTTNPSLKNARLLHYLL